MIFEVLMNCYRLRSINWKLGAVVRVQTTARSQQREQVQSRTHMELWVSYFCLSVHTRWGGCHLMHCNSGAYGARPIPRFDLVVALGLFGRPRIGDEGHILWRAAPTAAREWTLTAAMRRSSGVVRGRVSKDCRIANGARRRCERGQTVGP